MTCKYLHPSSQNLIKMNVHTDHNAHANGIISPTLLKVKRSSEGLRVNNVEPLKSKRTVVKRNERERYWMQCFLIAQMKKCRRRSVIQLVFVLILLLWVLLQMKAWKDYHIGDVDIIQPMERYIIDVEVSSAVMASLTNTVKHQRKTGLLQFSTMQNENHQIDSYSGMWWVRRDVFVSHWNASVPCGNYEAASFKLFNNVADDNICMAKDWLDFSVEHLSHYFKQLDIGSLPTFEGLIKNIFRLR